MTDLIYHHSKADLTGSPDIHGEAHVFLHTNGCCTVQMNVGYGAAHMSVQTDADSLRAFARLLADAVVMLPAKVEEAA
jgi:hypothetical protein